MIIDYLDEHFPSIGNVPAAAWILLLVILAFMLITTTEHNNIDEL